MKKLALLLLSAVAFAQMPGTNDPAPSVSQCPSGYEDMVGWMLPSNLSIHLVGSHDYKGFGLAPGKMYFIKSKKGWPLDEKLYDAEFVYDYITENGAQGWASPSAVKEYVIPVKLAPRCIPYVAVGKRAASVSTPSSETEFVSKLNCIEVGRHNLGYIIGQVWNQGMVNFGGTIGLADTRVLTYRWGCDSTYSNCAAREELWLARGYGWVEGKLYKNGQLINDTKSNVVQPGNVAPVQPCGDARVQ